MYVMTKTIEHQTDQEAVKELLRDLDALPPGYKMSGEEWLAYVRRLPKPDLPEGWTSADDIRELRGPLPEDDPAFPKRMDAI